MKIPEGTNIKLFLAIAVVAVVWGTTFLGIKIAVETIPPWFVAGLRQILAGLILFLFLIFKKQMRWLGWKSTIQQFVISTLMLIVANGFTTLAEANIDSSLASLVSSCSPILVFILSALFIVKKIELRSLAGVILGFSGILFVFWDGLEELGNAQYQEGIILLFLAITGWAVGTIYSKKILRKKENIFLILFYQFTFAGVVQLVLAFVLSADTTVSEWSITSILAVIYLAIFGSVVAFFSFNYLLQKLQPTQVAILSYLNTIIAIFLGWLILDEEITIKFMIAAVLIITGVFVTNFKVKISK